MRKPFLISCAVVLLAYGNAYGQFNTDELESAWQKIRQGTSYKHTTADFNEYVRLAAIHIEQKRRELDDWQNRCRYVVCRNEFIQSLKAEISRDEARKRSAEDSVKDFYTKKEQAERDARETDAKALFQSGIEKKLKAITETGYKLITVRDFVVDGETLAESHDKVVIKAAFISENPSSEYLIVGDFNSPNQVPVLSEDADRETRMLLATCRDNQFGPYGHYHGCNIVYLAGSVSKCSFSLFGQHIRDQPCLKVAAGFRAERTN